MNTSDTTEWQRTSPLAVIFYLGRVMQQIAQNAVQALAPLIALSFAYQGDLASKVAFIAVALAVFVVTAAILRWLFFRYQVRKDSILIREGVFRKTQLDIKFDRIQAINTEQNPVFRAFNLVTVTFDTAGSSGQEGHLPAVRTQFAESIRDRIRRRKSVATITPDQDEESTSTASRELLSLSNGDMIRIGLSDNRALIILAFFGPLLNQAEEEIGQHLDKDTVVAAFATQFGIEQGVSLVLLLIVGILIGLALLSVVGAFWRFHRYILVENDDIFESNGGLVTRYVHSIGRSKIQTLVSTQNIMLRIFGRMRIYAQQATSARGRSKKNFVVPICLPQQLAKLSRRFYDDEFKELDTDPRSDSFRPIAYQYVRSRILLAAVLPAGIAALLLSSAAGWYSLWLLCWIPLCSLAIWRLYRRYGVQVRRDGLALRKGFLGYRVTSFLHRKVQRIGVTQTLFQRRKGLATLRFYLASGTVNVPYVDYEKATALRDYVLFRVESSQLAWH